MNQYIQTIARCRLIETTHGYFGFAELTDDSPLCAWVDKSLDEWRGLESDLQIWPDALAALTAYFDGEALTFSDIPTPKTPPFFSRCWAVCRRIKRGKTMTSGEMAAKAGSPGASRAAGQAMRRNPLPIVVPCHRVVASSGDLHGYSGQVDPQSLSLRRKAALLSLESDRVSMLNSDCCTVGT